MSPKPLPPSLNGSILATSRQSALLNTICIRDFVDSIGPDPSREDKSNYVEISADVNIFEEGDPSPSDIIVEPIRTRIRTYLNRGDQNLYCPNAFFYAEGRFSIAKALDDALEINVQALSLKRYVPLRLVSAFDLTL